jgi:CHAT domain-containing protein
MLGSKANSLHLACHGYFDPDNPMASALETGQGETLTAQEIVDNLRLQAQIITLSACETGLSRVLRGDEPMGLTRAFIVAGAPAVVSTMWRVEEQSTRILMLRFYKELEQGISPVAALKQAQQYLRKLTRAEVNTLLAQQPLTNNAFDSDLDTVVFNHPYFWAPFIVMGDFESKSSG